MGGGIRVAGVIKVAGGVTCIDMERSTAVQISCIFHAPIISPYIELYAICQNDWREMTRKMYINFAQLYLSNR